MILIPEQPRSNPNWLLLLLTPVLLPLSIMVSAWASPDATLTVQPGASWAVTNPPAHPPLCFVGNPQIGPVQDVSTPAGPGIRTNASGNTFGCCENATAKKTFTFPAHFSTSASLSFYYQAGQTGSLVTTSMHLQFFNQGSQVGPLHVIRAIDPPGLNGSDPVGAPVTHIGNGAVATLNLQAMLGTATFDEIRVTLNHYGCVMTGFQVVSNFTLLGTPAPPNLNSGLSEDVSPPANGSTVDKYSSTHHSFTGNDYDAECECPCPCPEPSTPSFYPGMAGEGGMDVFRQDTGDPVDLASGEVTVRRVDLKVPGRGLHWTFERRYRSRINFNGPIGHNWEFNYHARLLLNPSTGNFTLVDGNARSDVYTRQTGGTYASPSGFFTRLKVLSGNPLNPAAGPITVEIVNRHQVRTRFATVTGGGNTLPMVRVQDRNGDAMQFLYEMSTLPLSLTKVLDTYGRPYVYLYDGLGRITTVRDYLGREILLCYDSNGDLNAVTGPAVTGTPNGNDFPAGKTEGYIYSSGFLDEKLNHNLRFITAPNEMAMATPGQCGHEVETILPTPAGPPRVEFVYDETAGVDSDRCTEQVLGRTNASGIPAGGTISYVREVLVGGPRGSVSKITTTDRNLNQAEYFMDAAGRPLILRELTRGLRPGEPVHFETNYFYNSDGMLVRKLLPELNEVNWVYSTSTDRAQQGNILTETLLPGPRGGDQTFLKKTWTYEPIFNKVKSATEERGNDPAFVPQNGGTQSAARYTTNVRFDYQEGNGTTNRAFLATATGRTTTEIQGLLAATGMLINLPDQNGDGVTNSAVNVSGNPIRIDAPTVNLLPGSPQALAEGRTAQARVTTQIFNKFGQRMSSTDTEENVAESLFYPENDPDGDGQDLLATNGAGQPSDTATGGYLKRTIKDASITTRTGAGDIGRQSGQNPQLTQIKTDRLLDKVGNVIGLIDGRGVKTLFAVNQLNQTVQITRAASVTDVPGRNGGANGGSENLSGQAFGYEEQVFFDFNDNVVGRHVENRDGNTPDAGAHPGFIEYGYAYDILDDLLMETQEVSPTETITWRHRYDGNQHRVRTLFPEGNIFSWTFDERDLLFTMTRGLTDPDASTVSYAYDGNRNGVKFTDAEDNNGDSLGDSSLTEFDGFDRSKTIKDPAGNVHEHHFDPASNEVLEKRFGPIGGPTPTNNSGSGNVLLAQEEHRFDEASQAYQEDHVLFVSAGVSTTRPVTFTEGPLTPGDGKITTRFGMDRLGRIRFRTQDDTHAHQTDFDGNSRGIHSVDGEENEIFTAFDDGGNPARVESVEKNEEGHAADQHFLTLARFDSLNRPAASISNLGHTRRLQFDSRNNVVASSDAQGPPSTETAMTVALVTLNSEGNTTRTFLDGINRVLRTELDLRTGGQGGNPLDTSNPSNPDGIVTLRQEWDKNSRLKNRTDDRINTTVYEWTARNLKKKETFADGTFHAWTFDRDDNVRTLTDANGSVRTCTHDSVNRFTRCQVSRGAGVVGTTEQTWEYDGIFRTTKSTDNNEPAVAADDSVVTEAYDSLSRLLEEHQILGGDDQVVSSDWQDHGNRKALTYPNGRKVGFTWDGLERMKLVSNLAGVPAAGQVAAYEYIGPGRLLSRAYANGTQLIPSYDGDKRATTWEHKKGAALVAGFGYTHDREDNRLSESRIHSGLGDAWAYDSIYRLVGQEKGLSQPGSQETRAWQLDGAGNWAALSIQEDHPGQGQDSQATLTQQMNSLNSYTVFGGVAQADDPEGNRLDDGNFLYRWDFLNRLREVRKRASGQIVAAYLFDAFGAQGHLNGSGRRILKSVFQGPAGHETGSLRFLFDGVSGIEERDAQSGKVLRHYVEGALLDEHLTMDVYLPNGKLDETYFFHEDAKGWTAALTDSKGAVRERVTYDAYGKPTFEDHQSKPAGNQRESKLSNPYLYSGRYLDAETGLFYFRHRMYSPEQGRWVSRDPIGIWEDGINRGNGYGYVGAMAPNESDLTGLIDTVDTTVAQAVARGDVEAVQSLMEVLVADGRIAATRAAQLIKAAEARAAAIAAAAAARKPLVDKTVQKLAELANKLKDRCADKEALAEEAKDTLDAVRKRVGAEGMSEITSQAASALKDLGFAP